MPRPRSDRPQEKCRICKRPVLVMCQKNTGYCSQLCAQKKKEE